MANQVVRGVLLAACFTAVASVKAQAPAVNPTHDIFPLRELKHTCGNPNPGFVFLQQDGGYQEAAQGWFYKVEVHQGSGSALAYCYYGADKATPSTRPVYSVHYEMTGFNSGDCSVAGATVTCSRQILTHP